MRKLILIIHDYESEGNIEIYGTMSGPYEKVMQKLLEDKVISEIYEFTPFRYGFYCTYSTDELLIIPEDQVNDYLFNTLNVN